MEKFTIIIVALIFFHSKVHSDTPVHVSNFTVDTSIYNFDIRAASQYYYTPGPFNGWDAGGSGVTGQMIVHALLKKNNKQFDIISFSGKIGTSTVPGLFDPNKSNSVINFSRNMIDNDDGWETIVNSYSNDKGHFFKVFDDDGTELLADSGDAVYGFDGKNTYVLTFVHLHYYYSFDTWRFRTNIMSPSNQPLAKTKFSQSLPMQIYGGTTGGDYRVTLSPSNGNQMNFQMFDLIGRCVFSKKIDNPTTPVTFTVPAGNVPNSPFVAKVNDGNGSFYKKGIPVK